MKEIIHKFLIPIVLITFTIIEIGYVFMILAFVK